MITNGGCYKRPIMVVFCAEPGGKQSMGLYKTDVIPVDKPWIK